MRKKIVAGNWKMNKDLKESIALADELKSKTYDSSVQLIVCPPLLFTATVKGVLSDSNINVGVQNCSNFENGAYTGEVSAEMVLSTGAEYAIIGHSERRSYFAENNELIKQKVDRVLSTDLTPIFCCGESLEERESGALFDVIKAQISESLFHLVDSEFKRLVIAYEPVWAIGTGKTATPDQAQEMHAFIREVIAEKYGNEIAQSISLLYGGSCNPKNAKELFKLADVDGGLIGGASLKAEDFISLANSF